MEKEITISMKKIICLIMVFVFFSAYKVQPAFSEGVDDPVPYSDSEFPQWALDVRRFEIVSLGSVPFAMIGVTLAYGAIQVNRGKMDSIPHLLNQSNLDEYQQFKILGLTICTGLCIGLVDFTVNQIIRYNKRKKMERINSRKKIEVIPIEAETEPEIIPGEIETVLGDAD